MGVLEDRLCRAMKVGVLERDPEFMAQMEEIVTEAVNRGITRLPPRVCSGTFAAIFYEKFLQPELKANGRTQLAALQRWLKEINPLLVRAAQEATTGVAVAERTATMELSHVRQQAFDAEMDAKIAAFMAE